MSDKMFILKIKTMSVPRFLLHIEGAFFLIFSIFMFFYLQGNWILFVILILAPDLAMAGYFKDTKLGSIVYNIFHIYAWPVALVILGIVLDMMILIQLALIWTAHIGMDRMLGYGLKYPTGFKDTHLKRI